MGEDTKKRFDQACIRLAQSESEARACGAPPAGARSQAIAAAWAVAGGEYFLAGGPREWGLALLADEKSEPATLLDVQGLGPGGHKGVDQQVAAVSGRPGGQLGRAFGSALYGRKTLVLCGARSFVDQTRLAVAAGVHKELPLKVLAVHEGLAGEPESGLCAGIADAAGWRVERFAGSGEELPEVLGRVLQWQGPALVEWDVRS